MVEKGAVKWKAQIFDKGKSIYLGIFHDEPTAAAKYDMAARDRFKEFAAPNKNYEIDNRQIQLEAQYEGSGIPLLSE